jgi:Ca2+/Na+ antiporter
MNYYDLIGFIGIAFGILAFFSVGRKQRLFLFLLSSVFLLIYTLLNPKWPFVAVFVFFTAYIVYEIFKIRSNLSNIKLIQVNIDDSYIQDFFSNYKKDIYNIFPFFNQENVQNCFLIFRNLDLIGVIAGKVSEKNFEIEVDYLKPGFRDYEIGEYMFKINPGYFKKLGVDRLITKSYHKNHTKYLKKMGFEETLIDGQMFFVKHIDDRLSN